MELFFRKVGENKPALIIMHGLYGASDNWMNIAKIWSLSYEVFLLDLRNHGRSPHSDIHTYQAMRDDVLAFMDQNDIQKAILVGHSMGGKVAMHIAMKAPERVNALVVVDIAPKNYTRNNDENVGRHESILKSMMGLDLNTVKRREDINQILSSSIPEERTRLFIMKNLKRSKSQSFEWKLNLPVIDAEILNITKGFDNEDILLNTTGFPVLFIRGERSKYIQDEDEDRLLEFFPFSDIETISDAGHWIHAEQPEALSEMVLEFLES